MAGIDSCVEDIRTRPCASARVVRVACGSCLGVGQASEAPWSVLLDSKRCDSGVLLDIVDLRKTSSVFYRNKALVAIQRGRGHLLQHVP